nr:hypothetical protein Iba_chr01dCG1390 [Ipomoea batatas]
MKYLYASGNSGIGQRDLFNLAELVPALAPPRSQRVHSGSGLFERKSHADLLRDFSLKEGQSLHHTTAWAWFWDCAVLLAASKTAASERYYWLIAGPGAAIEGEEKAPNTERSE